MLKQTPQTADFERHLDATDRAIADLDRGTVVERRHAPPSYGDQHRGAISSCVDALASDLCEKIGALRKALDQIEQHVLQSAAKSKGVLNDHVAVSVRINDEILHMQTVIAELAEDARAEV